MLSELEFRYLDKQFDAEELMQIGQEVLHSEEALAYLEEVLEAR